MKKLVLTLFLLTSLNCVGQRGPFGYGYGIRFGCGNDLDLTFTGGMLLAGGGFTYLYGAQVYPYFTPGYSTYPNQKQMNNIQTIGLVILSTGVGILIEESIRHSLHKRGKTKNPRF